MVFNLHFVINFIFFYFVIHFKREKKTSIQKEITEVENLNMEFTLQELEKVINKLKNNKSSYAST